MARIISFIILLVAAAALAADVKPCWDEPKFNADYKILETENKVQAKVFQDAPGATEEKYHKFTEVWVNITSLTKSFYKNKFPENAFTEYCSVREVIDRYLEQLIRFFQAKSEISEKEFKTSADPKILKKIVDKYTEIDACYENSRNLIGIHPAKINEVNVCSYNMKQAIECSKKIFENDQDEPLLGLISFTNFFVAEYDCEEDDRSPVKESALLLMYQGLADTSLWPGRQTFFHGYQQAVKDFFIM